MLLTVFPEYVSGGFWSEVKDPKFYRVKFVLSNDVTKPAIPCQYTKSFIGLYTSDETSVELT